MHFRVISAGRHDRAKMARCCDSVSRQTYNKFHHYVNIDCADESKLDARRNRTCDFVTGYRGLLRNVCEVMQGASDDEIVVIVDMDDYLHDHALWVVRETYLQHPEIMATYGSYESEDGRYGRYNGPLASDTPVRRQNWTTSHLKTFRASLWPHINQDSYMHCGRDWIEAAGDMALMYQIVELAGFDRVWHIPDPIYVYCPNGYSEHVIRSDRQKSEEMHIRAMAPRLRLPGADRQTTEG